MSAREDEVAVIGSRGDVESTTKFIDGVRSSWIANYPMPMPQLDLTGLMPAIDVKALMPSFGLYGAGFASQIFKLSLPDVLPAFDWSGLGVAAITGLGSAPRQKAIGDKRDESEPSADHFAVVVKPKAIEHPEQVAVALHAVFHSIADSTGGTHESVKASLNVQTTHFERWEVENLRGKISGSRQFWWVAIPTLFATVSSLVLNIWPLPWAWPWP